MVIPVPNIPPPSQKVNLSDVKRYLGNNLQLSFNQNWRTILVIGNNCRVTISENHGALKIVGNNCQADITECQGTIQYIGNNGRVSYGPGVTPEDVSYTGSNGHIGVNSSKIYPDNGQHGSSASISIEINSINVCGDTQLADKAFLIKNNVKAVDPAIMVKLQNMQKNFSFIPKVPSAPFY